MTEMLFNKAITNQYRSSMKSEFEPWVSLANAIIKQAVIDYRKATVDINNAKHILSEDPNNEEAIILLRKSRYTHKEINRFFRSEQFSVMTNIDGERLIRELKEEAA